MKKNDVFMALTIVVFFSTIYYFISNKPLQPVENKEVIAENPSVKPTTKRDLDPKTEAVKVVKEVPIAKEVTPTGKLLEPNAKLDDSIRSEQQEIAFKGYGSFPPVDMEKMNPNKEFLIKALQNPEKNPGAISIVGKREKL